MIDTTKKISAVSYNGSNLPLATQTKTVTPTTEEQVITGDDGYTLTSVTVEAVTKDIDSNIQSGNIKSGVSILGVEGVLEGNKLPDVLNKTVTSLTAGDLIGVTQIPNYAFQDCTNLVSLELPSTIVSIGEYAFDGCNNIESDINLPNQLESIGSYAFNGCQKISGDIVISDNIVEIPNYAFNNCLNIKNISIGKNVEEIKTRGFAELRECSNITFSPNSRLSKIGQYAFYFLSYNTENGINEFKLPSTLTELDDNSFYRAKIKKIFIPNGNINAFAVMDSSVEEVYLGEGVSYIGLNAFSYCHRLTSITLPSSLTSIGSSAFTGCVNLKSVIYNGQAPNIMQSTFFNCNLIKKYDFRNCTTIPTLYSTTSLGHATGCQIIVPDALYNEWTVATNWVALTDVNFVKASEYVE